ncbi:MAG: Fibronectin, type domain protein [Bacteroidota bacterium]|nr:Fibronectin, type domain protein [Bacteroidota bacterium]
MKSWYKLLPVFIFMHLCGSLFSQTLTDRIWTDTIGFPTFLYQFVNGINDGSNFIIVENQYVTGQQQNYVYAKIDGSGNLIYQNQFNSGNNGRDYATSLKVKGSYLYITGFTWDSTAGTAVYNTVKVNNTTGDTIWSSAYHGFYNGYDAPATVLADDSGNVYIAGTEQNGPLASEMTVLKLDSNGHQKWVAHYDSVGMFTSGVDMSLDPGKGVTVTGFSGTGFGSWDFVTVYFDVNGGFLNVSSSSNGSGNFSKPVGVMGNGQAGITVAGTSVVSGNKTDIKVIDYDSVFHQSWVSTWGDSLPSVQASSMTIDFNGHILVCGTVTKTTGKDIVLLSFNSGNGSLAWARKISAQDTTKEASGVTINCDGNANSYLTGRIYNGNDFDIITASYDQYGNFRWSKTYNRGTNTDDEPTALAVQDDGSVIVAGTSIGTDTVAVEFKYAQWDPAPCNILASPTPPCPTITYTFKNPQITTVGSDSFVEFDIYAIESMADVHFSSADIYFTYRKPLFGDSIVDYSNIIVTRGLITANTNYVFTLADSLRKSDIVPIDGKEVKLSIVAADSTMLYVIGADTAKQLCHIKMKLKGRGNPGICFDQYYMENKSVLYDTSSLSHMEYNYVYAGGPVKTLRSADINGRLVNMDFTGSPGYLTFDVQVQSNSGDPFYGADITIAYNTDNFGSSASVNCTQSASSSVNSSYFDLAPSSSSGTITIEVSPNGSYITQYPYGGTNPTSVISAYTTIASCSLTVLRCCTPSSGAYINITSVSGEYAVFALNDLDSDQANWYHYLDATASYNPGSLLPTGGYDNGGGNICPVSGGSPVIDNLDPLTITAGTFSILTITGTGFGCTPGKVLFPNANDGGLSMAHTENLDIQSWDDSQIKAWVPSRDADGGCAGSGQIVVKTAGGSTSSLSGASLHIPYAATNIRNSTNNSAIYVGLISTDANGGYTFNFDNAMSADAIASITQAMNDWICQTGVNFTMGSGINTPVASPTDGKNSIFYGTTANGNAAETRAYAAGVLCTAHSPSSISLKDIDIIISNGIAFDEVNHTTPNAGHYTLLGVVRHEFGHASCLQENLNFGDLMYWQTYSIGDPALPISFEDQSGGIYILTDVGPNQLSSCYTTNVWAFPIGCPTVNSVNNISSNPFNLSVNPNPFNESITIHAQVAQITRIKVNVYNVLGQSVATADYGLQGPLLNESINLSHLSPDLYIIEILIGEQIWQFKLIKS